MATPTTPLLIEGPKADSAHHAIGDAPIIELEAAESATAAHTSPEDSEAAAAVEASRWTVPAYAPLAAAVVFALAIGAIAGAAATSNLLRQPSSAPATAEATRALQVSVAQLGNELATLKSGIANVQRSASTQFGKIAERLDRSEKALAEPAAKLAKLQDSIDRIDHRQQTAAAAAADVTGSVTPKEQAKPAVAEGWRLRDFYAGRAVVQSRNGTLFEVGPGSNLPGLGKVETVKRENGQVIVTAKNGIIAGSFEQRHPSYYLPYRY